MARLHVKEVIIFHAQKYKSLLSEDKELYYTQKGNCLMLCLFLSSNSIIKCKIPETVRYNSLVAVGVACREDLR